MGVCQNYGYPFGGPYNKDYNILRSILGSRHLGNVPYRDDGKETGNYYLGFRVQGLGQKAPDGVGDT